MLTAPSHGGKGKGAPGGFFFFFNTWSPAGGATWKGCGTLGAGALMEKVGQPVHIAPLAVLSLLPEFQYEEISSSPPLLPCLPYHSGLYPSRTVNQDKHSPL